jgi:hypothetical protein
MLVSGVCCVLQLKWNLPDETGGEMITQYQLKVKPSPPGFACSQPDEEVRGRTQFVAEWEQAFVCVACSVVLLCSVCTT